MKIVNISLKILGSKIIYNLFKGRVDSVGIKNLIVRYAHFTFAFVYVIWWMLTILFQVFFHYIPLDDVTFNIILLSILTLGAISFINYPINKEIIDYTLNSYLSINLKRRLLFYNEIASIIVPWIIWIICLLPFFVVQFVYTNIQALICIFHILIFLLLLGFINQLIKYMYLLCTKIVDRFSKRYILTIFYIVLCYYIFLMVEKFAPFIKGYIFSNDKIEFFSPILEKLSLSNIVKATFYPVSYYLIGLGVTFLIIIFIYTTIQTLIAREFLKATPFWFIRVSNPYLLVFTHFKRKHGVIDSDFIITFFLLSLFHFYTKNLNISFYIFVHVPIFIFVTLFLQSHVSNVVHVILLLKTLKTSILRASLSTSVYIIIKFSVIQLFAIWLYEISLKEYIEYGVTGFIVIFTIVIVYVCIIYVVDGLVEVDFIYFIAKWGTNIYISCLLGIFIIGAYLKINFIIIAIVMLGINFFICMMINKKRNL